MQLGSGVGVHYIFEVEREVPPALGDRFRDPRGHVWYVRGVRPERGIKLRDPLPTHPIWEVQLDGEHVAYYLGIGEDLEALHEGRSSGALYREKEDTIGFGTIAREGDGFSWIFRGTDTSWNLQVGPLVPTFAAFSSTLFARSGTYRRDPGALPWGIVTNALDEFVRLGS